MVAGFHSFHWHGCDLGDEALTRAHVELMEPTGEDAYLAAFRTLLHSGQTAAAGIALDHFQYSGALTRFGGQSVVEQYEPEVLAVARALLRQPPVPVDEGTFAGANHASALNAMMNIAQPADGDLIADALSGASDPNVREAACSAASSALARCAGPSPRLVTALGVVAFDERLDMRERSAAIGALFEADGSAATGLLIRAAESPWLDLQIEGAIGLMLHGRSHVHRTRVKRLAATWPADAGYRADEVRELLAARSRLD